MKEYNFQPEDVRRAVLSNRHNNVTTTYYLLLKSYIKNGATSIADLVSPEYYKYMKSVNKKVYHVDQDVGRITKPKNKLVRKHRIIDPREDYLDVSLNSSMHSNVYALPPDYPREERKVLKHDDFKTSTYGKDSHFKIRNEKIVIDDKNKSISKEEKQNYNVIQTEPLIKDANVIIINKKSVLKAIKGLQTTTNTQPNQNSQNHQNQHKPGQSGQPSKEESYYSNYHTEILNTQGNQSHNESEYINTQANEKDKENRDIDNIYIKKKNIKINQIRGDIYKHEADKKLDAKKNAIYELKNFINTSMSYDQNDIKNATYDGTEDLESKKKKIIEAKKLLHAIKIKKDIMNQTCPEFYDDDKVNQVFNINNINLESSNLDSILELSKQYISSSNERNNRTNNEKISIQENVDPTGNYLPSPSNKYYKTDENGSTYSGTGTTNQSQLKNSIDYSKGSKYSNYSNAAAKNYNIANNANFISRIKNIEARHLEEKLIKHIRNISENPANNINKKNLNSIIIPKISHRRDHSEINDSNIITSILDKTTIKISKRDNNRNNIPDYINTEINQHKPNVIYSLKNKFDNKAEITPKAKLSFEPNSTKYNISNISNINSVHSVNTGMINFILFNNTFN